MTFGSEGGVDDQSYLRRLRELLGDVPIPSDEQFSGTGHTKFQCSHVPINDDLYLTITADGSPVTVTTNQSSIPGGSVYLDYDTGLMIFGTTPNVATNNVVISKNQVRWRDDTLIGALYGGLRSLWPKLFKIGVDTSIKVITNRWEYNLPSDFNDPRTEIMGLYLQEIPSTTNRFAPISDLYKVGLNTIEFPPSQFFTPGAIVKIEYATPFRSLSELDPQGYDLPLWYAAAQLLGFGESRRTRSDSQTVASGNSMNPPQYQQNAGSWYMNQYLQLKNELIQKMKMPSMISTYSR